MVIGFASKPNYVDRTLLVTPHMSARTYRGEGLRQITEKIKALSSGAPIASLAGVVDLKKGY